MSQVEEQRKGGREPIAPATIGLLVLALILVASGHWRGGVDLLGITMIAGGVARLVLPTRRVGALAVRHRLLDSVMLIGVGVALIVLVYIVPTG